MACGAPVIASKIASLTETVGTEAARLVPPTDSCALARAITDLLADGNERRSRSSLGRERAALFTWEKTARATLKVYGEALRRKEIQSASGAT
ncbi:MAG TPA: glycosyltransferase, partial [Pyrinomonadaceae bacterium]|nr:glycosyltransferase [Pyrinomonadaceae bacterium]